MGYGEYIRGLQLMIGVVHPDAAGHITRGKGPTVHLFSRCNWGREKYSKFTQKF